MKPTAANVDKEAPRWSLSWLPDGHCDSFTKEAILLFAPPTSGVYGLFNFDCQVFIGESANIQKALLRHQSETDFRSQHLQPTGFTFEPCAAELRKSKADELIAKFHPVLQAEAALTEPWSPSNSSMVREVSLGAEELKTFPDHQEFAAQEREERPKVRRRSYFKRKQGAMLTAIFVAGTVIIFYFGLLGDKNIHEQMNGEGEESLARISISQSPASGRAGIGLEPQKLLAIDTAGSRANQSADPSPAKPEVHASALASNGAVRFSAKSASAKNTTGVQGVLEPAKTSQILHSVESADLSKKWSVQISAAPAKDVADTLVQRLKAKGYDAYVVQAEVKGQTYHRVRVGRFNARAEAEPIRHSLALQEGYRDAYLTGD